MRAGIEDGGVVQRLVFIEAPGRLELLAAQLLHPLLGGPLEVVDLDRQRSPHEVEQDLGDLAPSVGAGAGQRGVLVRPDVLGRADVVERLVADLEQAALLEVGGGDAPAPAQVAIEPVSQHVSQGTLGLGGRGEAHLGIACVELDRQVRAHRRPFAASTSCVMPAGSSCSRGRVQGRAQQADLDEVVEVARLEAGVLAIVGEAQQLACPLGQGRLAAQLSNGRRAKESSSPCFALRS